jgi:hypothetical protein
VRIAVEVDDLVRASDAMIRSGAEPWPSPSALPAETETSDSWSRTVCSSPCSSRHELCGLRIFDDRDHDQDERRRREAEESIRGNHHGAFGSAGAAPNGAR